jgi:outer membrane translocation and assembly module TamA
MPMPTPRIEPQENGDVNITFEVKEKQTGSVNFGTAVGGGAGLAGFLGYDQPNLFGKAKGGHIRWEFGKYSNNFEAPYSDPAIADSRYSGSVSLFSSRDRFFRFSEGQRRRTGVSIRAGTQLPRDARSRFTLGEDFFIGVSGDVGGFGAGSKLTYQVLGTVGWEFADSWSLQAGYRYFSVNKEIDGDDIKLKLHGPIIAGLFVTSWSIFDTAYHDVISEEPVIHIEES